MKNGYQNEKEIISYLDGKKKKETHIIFQELLEKLYPNIKDNDIIRAIKYEQQAKCDMVLIVNGIRKGISIKCGFKNSVHTEKIENFLILLKKLKFTKLDELARYLYSDGTNNNTGDERQSSSVYKLNHQNEINDINKQLNSNILQNYLIRRFLISGNINYSIQVDAFIYGTLYNFIWLTTNEVINYLLNVSTLETSGVHVSNLYIQEWNKNLNRNPKYEKNREYIQVKWYSLMKDAILIMCERYK